MGDAPLVIDVAADALQVDDASAVVVLVEPLYGVPAVALALDAGWGSVEVCPQWPGAPPIPLVSFEQPPAPEHRGGRCRVRCDDLWGELDGVWEGLEQVVLGAPLIARPLATRLVAARPDHVVLAPSRRYGDAGAPVMCRDAWWAAGMLIRVLLEELDERPARLTDAAGMAVTLAQGAEPAAALLGNGQRWDAHVASGGSADDVRVAAAVDTVGAIPRVELVGDSYVARAWSADI